VVHRCLQYIADDQAYEWCDQEAISAMLQEEGTGNENLAQAAEKVCDALRMTLADERGRWLLAAHEEAVCEYPVTVCRNGVSHGLVLDRSFVDADGSRWIIDYKTSTHEGGDLAGFIESEEKRYREQLENYRDALQIIEPGRQIRVALYFPLLQVFREVSTLAG
jgi:ATP-dependent exoDNAse (exonuclease V) beta subunit